jgi:hypothetical protein
MDSKKWPDEHTEQRLTRPQRIRSRGSVRLLAVVLGWSGNLAVRTPLRWTRAEPRDEDNDSTYDKDPKNCQDRGVHWAHLPESGGGKSFCSRGSGYAS